jgi:hypothetical protein
MTQAVTTALSSLVPVAPAAALVSSTLDNAILTAGWSTPIAATDESIFIATPAAGGSIAVQFSADGVNWVNAAAVPYSRPFTGGVPAYALWVRAQAQQATATLTVATSPQLTYAVWSSASGSTQVRPDGSLSNVYTDTSVTAGVVDSPLEALTYTYAPTTPAGQAIRFAAWWCLSA